MNISNLDIVGFNELSLIKHNNWLPIVCLRTSNLAYFLVQSIDIC